MRREASPDASAVCGAAVICSRVLHPKNISCCPDNRTAFVLYSRHRINPKAIHTVFYKEGTAMLFKNRNENKKDVKDRKKDSSDKKDKQPSRPWYDISLDDMIMYDLFDDE